MRQAVLQKAIYDATNQAKDHTTHRRKLPQGSHKKTCDRKTNGGQQTVSNIINPAASPSTLQLSSEVMTVPQHKPEMRSSRIPVRTRARATNKDIIKTIVEDDQLWMKEHPHPADHTSPAHCIAEEDNKKRIASPPVPALAKKLKQQGLLNTEERPPLPTLHIQVKKNKPPVSAATSQKKKANQGIHMETLPPIMSRPPACKDEGTPIIPAVRRKNENFVYLPLLSTSDVSEPQRDGVIFQQLSKLRKVHNSYIIM